MAKKNREFVHITAKRSWWSGRIWALCGATQEAGRYQTDTWRLFALPGPACPACERIERDRKSGGRS